jgi:hypothetical protein
MTSEMLEGCVVKNRPGTYVNGIKIDDGGEGRVGGNVLWKPRKCGYVSMTRNHEHARACHLDNPIHVKEVPCLNGKAFEKKLCGAERAVWRDLKKFIEDERVLQKLHDEGRQRKHVTSALLNSDVDEMVRCGVARKCREGEKVYLVNSFSVDELKKKRRRAIHHPATLNDNAPIPCLGLADFGEVKEAVGSGAYRWGVTADLKAWYYQIPLAFEVQKYFGFKNENGETFVLSRLPMGAAFSCGIAHFISSAFASWVCRGLRVKSFVYIDNFFFLADDEEALTIVQSRLRGLEKEMNVEFGEISEVSQVCNFIGFDWDLQERRGKVGEKTLTALAQMEIPTETTWSRREILAFFGKVFGALAPFPSILAKYFFALKFYRRVASEATKSRESLDRKRTIWPSLRQDLASLKLEASTPKWFALSRERSGLFVASDASSGGFGCSVLFPRGAHNWGGAFTKEEAALHINLKEGLAVLKTLKKFDIADGATWAIDNSPLYFALLRGYSASFALNTIVRKIRATHPNTSFVLVPSGANPADVPSRWLRSEESEVLFSGRWFDSSIFRVLPLP